MYGCGFNLCKVQSMDDNCGEWVECMGVATVLGVVVRRYIGFLILVFVLFYSSIPTFCSLKKSFSFLFQ